MKKSKVLIFVVTYNAEKFIEAVLKRIPDEVWNNPRYETEVLIIDDQSSDRTFEKAVDYARLSQKPNITILFNPKNQGYGGNQKIGYHYAVLKGFDAVVLLHGDGQYPPEFLPQVIDPIINGDSDVVLASRMVNKMSALKGRMPFYKWIGNQILTTLQNWVLGSKLSEFHTGYRAYRVSALAAVPFQYDSDYFDFDTDIIIQMLDTHRNFKEIAIPTYYGDEISRVNGFKYGAMILYTSLLSRVMRWGIFYHPKFDYTTGQTNYTLKLNYPSSHEFALQRVKPGTSVLDIASGPGYFVRELASRQVHCTALDREINDLISEYAARTIEADVETYDFGQDDGCYDAILVLDILEHLRSPESLLKRLRQRYCDTAPEIIITTANIAYLPLRLALLFGQFNYGRRGILDLDHVRLFTFYSLRRILEHQGFEILHEEGIPAPFPAALGDRPLARFLLRLNTLMIKLSKNMFAYQIAVVVRPRPTVEQLLKNARAAGEQRRGATGCGGQ